MEIYVVQVGDNVKTIADKYGISIERLINDNGLINPYSLVVGQTLVILYPKATYTVKSGDTLTSIADENKISIMQLIRNNPYLYDRQFIYPDDTLVIEYNTIRDIQNNGYTNAYLNLDILTRALPYLTYLSIYNYQINDNSKIISFGDDTEIIKIAKQYDTIPLLMISVISFVGEINVEFVYALLLDYELQDTLIHDLLQILREKEFLGVNLLINDLTEYNQSLYLNILSKLSKVLKNEDYLLFITVNTDFNIQEEIDYNKISLFVDRIIFLQNIWEIKKQPPSPISNISLIRPFIENVSSKISPELISLGKPLIGYDWVIPFAPGTTANFMSLNSTIVLALDQNTEIQLDEVSQTPYYNYERANVVSPEKHIVWFIDARSIRALDNVILENGLVGTGLWNIASYNQQLFSITNAVFKIIKIKLP